jgi:hypothetical protein
MAEPLTAGAARLEPMWTAPARHPSWRVEAAVIAATALAATLLSLIGDRGIFAGRFPDPDDYLRMTLTTTWLDGAGWWDMSLARLDPPGGTFAHWSRLTDLPIAALILPLEPWLGRLRATYVAAGIVPPLLLVGFLYAVLRLARPMLGRRLALLAAPVSLLSSYIRFDFVPGHVDHHNWHLLLAALALSALLRLALDPGNRRAAAIAALAFALALWTGGETLPWLAAANFAFCLTWVLQGRPIPGAGLTFATILWGFCLVLLPLVHAPATRWVVACDSFGTYFANLPGFMLAFWAGLWALARHVRGIPGRAAAAIGSAALTGAALLLVFPECRAGPFSQIDPRLIVVLLDHNVEMSSARDFFGGYWRLVPMLLGPLLGTIFAVVQTFRCRGRARSAWLLFAVFAFIALAISCLHIQVLGPAEMFAVVPLVSLLASLERRLGPWRTLVSAPSTVAAVATLILVVLPFATAVAMLPAGPGKSGLPGPDAEAAERAGKGCDLLAAAAVLNDPAGLGATRRLIAAPVNDGAELLFRTRHDLLAAPFHRDVRGNLDIFDFFGARQESAARAIAARRRIDLVLFCPDALGMWLPQAEGSRNFFGQLVDGEIPDWLRPVAMPRESGVRLYEVVGVPR